MPTAWIIAASLAASQTREPPAHMQPYYTEHGVSNVAVGSGRIDRISVHGDLGWQTDAEVWVWVPDGYRDSGTHYPVIYMHDGQNLFDPTLTNYGKAWRIDEAISRLARQGDLREWIVVGIRSPSDRYMTLFPEKLYDHLPSELHAALSDEEGKPRPRDDFKGDEYLYWLVHGLKPAIDRKYRTLEGREDTAVMGASMGALSSLYAIGEYPEIFGAAGALSTPIMLAVYGEEDAPSVSAIADAWNAWLDTTELIPGGSSLIYNDTGMVGMDANFAPYLEGFDAMMTARGWTGADYQSRRYLGAEHDELFWHQRVDVPLAFMDRKDP